MIGYVIDGLLALLILYVAYRFDRQQNALLKAVTEVSSAVIKNTLRWNILENSVDSEEDLDYTEDEVTENE